MGKHTVEAETLRVRPTRGSREASAQAPERRSFPSSPRSSLSSTIQPTSLRPLFCKWGGVTGEDINATVLLGARWALTFGGAVYAIQSQKILVIRKNWIQNQRRGHAVANAYS
jgi:hypothetical protein